jgi:GTPase SAR1 family protein
VLAWLQDTPIHTYYIHIREKTDENIQVMLIGNKLDLVHTHPEMRATSLETVTEFCRVHELHYFETSARSGYNVK